MKAVPYIVMVISFLPFVMIVAFVWIGLSDYEKEKKAKELDK
jgi:hypothetical protein